MTLGRVAIGGAGPAGLAATLGLQRVSSNTAICERYDANRAFHLLGRITPLGSEPMVSKVADVYEMIEA